jgi:hypothetical protein
MSAAAPSRSNKNFGTFSYFKRLRKIRGRTILIDSVLARSFGCSSKVGRRGRVGPIWHVDCINARYDRRKLCLAPALDHLRADVRLRGRGNYRASQLVWSLTPSELAAPARPFTPQYAIQAALKSPELQKEFAREGATTAAMSSAAFGAFIKSEIAKWSRVVKDDNIQAQ